MPLYGPGLYTIALPSRRHVVIVQTIRIEPIVERGDRTVVLEGAAIPHAPKRRHLVIAGPATSGHGEGGVRADRHRQQIKAPAVLVGYREVLNRCQFVVRV